MQPAPHLCPPPWSARCAALLLLLQLLHGGTAERALKFVTLVYRHGDRSTIEPFPTDLHKEDAWPQGFGQLSEIGILQHYELGQYLRKRYQGFLNDTYDRNEIYVRSTDFDRTLMSAQANLAGLYPPTGEQLWNPKLLWQPIPVHTVPQDEEQLLAYPTKNCPRFTELTEETHSSREFQTLIKPYQDFINNVSAKSGFTADQLIAKGKLWVVYDALFCEGIHNMSLPGWATPEVMNKLKQVSLILLRALFDLYKHEEKSRLQGGVLVGAILKNFTDFTQTNSTKQKMIVYSAHDSTLAALHMALNVFNDQLLPYAGCHLFELFQEDDGKYSIDMYFHNESKVDPYPLLLPGCTQPCLLQKFTELVSPIIPADLKKECGVTDADSAKGTIAGLAFAVGLMLIINVLLVFLLCCRKNPRNGYQDV